uniref:uncharacterized protein LOC122585502 n=1 Tax=Erigeron canadensis TaxID=72917 RepID=UPI001CB88BBD|nr:uncharacterized protein LOC122585502 [Erigeron canadensis]
MDRLPGWQSLDVKPLCSVSYEGYSLSESFANDGLTNRVGNMVVMGLLVWLCSFKEVATKWKQNLPIAHSITCAGDSGVLVQMIDSTHALGFKFGKQSSSVSAEMKSLKSFGSCVQKRIIKCMRVNSSYPACYKIRPML